jgi:hypothetical protein
MGKRSAIGLAILALVWTTPVLADAADIETDYRLSAERVAKHLDMNWLDGSKAGEHALAHAWTRLADWTVAYLNEHPHATVKRLKNASPNASNSSLYAVLLAPKVYLVGAGVDGFGTVFIVDGTDGAYRLAWSIRGRADRDAFPILSAWSAAAPSRSCQESDDDLGRCGTLSAELARLPDGQAGHVRFYVNATYAQMAETTVAGQLSLWTWDGHTAHPLFAKRYLYNFEDESIRMNGDVMIVRASDSYRSFFNCGTCIGRQMNWRLRLGEDGVEDLGMTPVIPELDAADELLYRAARHRAMDDMASPEAQAVAQKLMAGAYHDAQDKDYISVGMMGDQSIRHRDERSFACLQTDEAGTLTFTMERREGGLYVTHMTAPPPDSNEPDRACPHDKP